MKCIPLPYSKNSLRIFLENESCHLGRDINWAENISDAWELFEEMPFGTCITSHYDHEETYYTLILGDNINYVEIDSNTAPEAICLAWIKWKESNI